MKKLVVIAGAGTREYYRKRGFELVDYGYMSKEVFREENLEEPF